MKPYLVRLADVAFWIGVAFSLLFAVFFFKDQIPQNFDMDDMAKIRGFMSVACFAAGYGFRFIVTGKKTLL